MLFLCKERQQLLERFGDMSIVTLHLSHLLDEQHRTEGAYLPAAADHAVLAPLAQEEPASG